MRKDELVDIVDEHDVVLYQTTRKRMRRANLLHRNVPILCRNAAGGIYVHRRSPEKDLFSSRYDMFTSGASSEPASDTKRRRCAS